MNEQAHLTMALADRYQIERAIGSGGMATVYLARDLKHDRDVALKVLKPEVASSVGSERFLREIRTTANLNHPHILPLHDSGEADGLLFYVMPLSDGESLRERLTQERLLPVPEALRITEDVAEGLAYAHELGVVHRDIKPENILLSRGHAIIADFGIARAVSFAGDTTLTNTGSSVGTPTYMSPEQASGDRNVDARADQYSLACVLYEMLAGEPPFTGQTAQAVMAKHAVEPRPSVRTVRDTVPERVDTALKQAMARAAVDRFQSTGEFRHALSAPEEVGDVSDGFSTKSRRFIWRPSMTVLGTLGLVAFGAWAIAQFTEGDGTIETIPPEQAEGTEIVLSGLDRDAIISTARRDYDNFETDNARGLLKLAALSVNGNPPDSLWAFGVHLMAQIWLEEGEEEVSRAWLRWARRLLPNMQLDEDAFLPEISALSAEAARAIRGEPEPASSIKVVWESVEGTWPLRGFLSMRVVGLENPVLRFIDPQWDLVPRETYPLKPNSYEIELQADDFGPVRLVCEALPGVLTVVTINRTP